LSGRNETACDHHAASCRQAHCRGPPYKFRDRQAQCSPSWAGASVRMHKLGTEPKPTHIEDTSTLISRKEPTRCGRAPRQTTAPHTRRRRPGPGIPHHAPAASRATGSCIPPPAITCRRPADQQSIGRSIRRRPSGATCSGRGHHTHRDGGTRSSSRTPQPQNGGPTTADRKHAQQSAAPRSGTTCPPMTTAPHLPGGPTTVQTARPAHQPPRRGAPPARQGRPGTWPAEGLSRSRSHGAQPESWRSGSAETERQQCREQQRCYHDEAAAQRRRLPRPPGTQGRQQSSQRPPSAGRSRGDPARSRSRGDSARSLSHGAHAEPGTAAVSSLAARGPLFKENFTHGNVSKIPYFW